LFNELRKLKPTVVVDIHDHLRTKLLRLFFNLTGVKTIVFEKGRAEKKKAVRANDKLRGQLTHTTERYHHAFEKIGFKFQLQKTSSLFVKKEADEKLKEWIESKNIKSKVWVGVAPFAAHASKMWPIGKYKEVIEKLSATGSYHFFLFGGGKSETEQLAKLQTQFANVTSTAGELGLNRELALIEKLSLMLCGDSSNMHLAALLNVPVVSVWGGTHPHLGFGPWGQGEEAIVQVSVEELPCRPCSVYGTSKCLRGDFACLTQIDPQKVADRIREKLK
jgi:ADP-heptose:LPS heptosyltransferase